MVISIADNRCVVHMGTFKIIEHQIGGQSICLRSEKWFHFYFIDPSTFCMLLPITIFSANPCENICLSNCIKIYHRVYNAFHIKLNFKQILRVYEDISCLCPNDIPFTVLRENVFNECFEQSFYDELKDDMCAYV